MRSLSVKAMLYVLLIVSVFCWGPLSKPAVAQTEATIGPSGITLGFSVDSAGLKISSEQGEEIGRYLESRLSIPVKERSFVSEEQLYNWLTRFHEVDVVWFSKGFLSALPVGQLYSLAEGRDLSSGLLLGEIVVRSEMNADLRQRLRAAFLSMHESSPGQTLLSKLGVDRFVSPAILEASPPVESSVTASDQATSPSQIVQQEEPDPEQQLDVAEELPSSATPSPKPDPKTSISLVSDYLAYNSEDDIYEARGDVVLHKDEVELKAEELLWQATTQDAAAQGSVQLNDADAKISGDRLQYNVATGQGQIHDGQVFISEGNFHLAGKQVEKHSRINYFVENGTFTTCDGEVPDWKFTASEVDVTLGGHAKAKNAWFYIRDVPVLYSPYLEFPVQTERESGFLMPAFGYSDTRGTRASVAWYQVIDRHLDATIYLDYLSDIGLGKGLEYRYALANQNNGKALYYHVTGLKGTSDLSYVKWQHRGELPADWRLTADIEYTDRKLFFEEFGEDAEDYNRDKTVSTLILQRNWQRLNLVGYARYIKDLETNNDETLQRLPEVGLNLARYRLGDTPFYADLESYATRFQRNSGVDGERFYLRPSLSAVYKPGLWLEIVPEVAFYERLYNTDARGDEKFVPEVSLTLATRLVKNLDVNRWGIERIQHSFEPKAVYTYVPDESQDDLPLFDLFDRIRRRNDVTYALINRLTARTTATDGSRVYRELLNLRFSQRYDIDEARNNRSGKDRPFSDLRVELNLQPTRNISLKAESLIPVYGNDGFRTLRLGTSVRDNKGNAVRVDYSYEDVAFASVATDFIRFQLDTSILKPVYAKFVERYDFRDGRALEKTVGLEYRSKCWSLLMSYRNRYREDSENDNEFMVTFILAGLGQDQGIGYGFGAVGR